MTTRAERIERAARALIRGWRNGWEYGPRLDNYLALEAALAAEGGGLGRCFCGKVKTTPGNWIRLYGTLHTDTVCPEISDILSPTPSPALAAEGGQEPRFRLEGKGVIDTVGGLDRCTGCGKLPPHAGSKAICAACAPPTGACYCAGCTVAGKGAPPPTPSTPAPATGEAVATPHAWAPGIRMKCLRCGYDMDAEPTGSPKHRLACPGPTPTPSPVPTSDGGETT